MPLITPQPTIPTLTFSAMVTLPLRARPAPNQVMRDACGSPQFSLWPRVRRGWLRRLRLHGLLDLIQEVSDLEGLVEVVDDAQRLEVFDPIQRPRLGGDDDDGHVFEVVV